MYICNDCHHVFDEPEVIYDDLGLSEDELHGTKGEEIGICPNCRRDDFCEAVECCECGGYVSKMYSTEIDGSYICEYCVAEIMKKYNDLLDKTFTEFEKSVIFESE